MSLRPCPVCGKPAAEAFRPFCSRRCADIDLAHWLRGDYRVAGESVDPEARAPDDEE